SLLTSSDYTDTSVTNGVTYYYVVTAVDLGAHESGNSNEDSAAPIDTAPVAPTGLVATKGVGEVSLDWDDNSESDLDGYNVYRSTDSGGSPTPYTKLNGSLLTSSDYTDTSVTNGVTYYYVVTAVDLGAHESGNSNEDSARPVGPPQTLLDDGFEGTPWDDNWDGNGTTTWVQDSSKPNSGTYYAHLDNSGTPGYLTSDDLDTFVAESITVSFWFNTKAIEAGDCVLQTYNGSTWNTWYDLTSYPTYVNNVWCQFSEVTTDSQYFVSNFRVRFDSLVLGSDGNEQTNIDDVLIAINQ
ncbi:fibronectin type III domain-containing protein, partial [Chloroflexota bacterium]